MVKSVTTDLVKLILASGSPEDTINTLNDKGLLEAYKHEEVKGLKERFFNYVKEKRAKNVLLDCNIYRDGIIPNILKAGSIIGSGVYNAVKYGAEFGPIAGLSAGSIAVPVTYVVQRLAVDTLCGVVIGKEYTKKDGKVYEKKIKEAIKLLKEDESIELKLEKPSDPAFGINLRGDAYCMPAMKSLFYMSIGILSTVPALIGSNGATTALLNSIMECKCYTDIALLVPSVAKIFKGLKDMPNETVEKKSLNA